MITIIIFKIVKMQKTKNPTINAFVALPTLLTMSSLLLAQSALAQHPPTADVTPKASDANSSTAQINNVFKLRDVSPDDWAFEALQNLIERYGCIAGSSNNLYEGDRALTRYEFAAALNQCLRQIEDLISNNPNEVTEADLATLQRLTRDFEAELATLSTRVDNLEERTTVLEDNQFSTTAKLKGTVLFSLNSALGKNRAVPVFADANDAPDLDEGVVLNNRVRLNFDSSFTGRDLLKVRLDSTDVTRFNARGTTGTNMTRLAFDRNTNGNFVVGKLFYRGRLGERFSYALIANRGRFNAHIDNFNNFFANAVRGSISNFGRFNPIYIQGATGAGVNFNYELSDSLTLSGGYLARNPSNVDQGLFNGSFAALGQLAFAPRDNLRFGLTYVRGYYPGGETFVSGGTGSRVANAPFSPSIATSANHFGFQANSRLSSNFILAGWAGLTQAQAEESGTGFDATSVTAGDDATVFNWALTFAFPNVDNRGNRAGLIIGQPPKVTANDGGPTGDESAFHIEGSYRYQVNDNISIEPGVLVIFNPENNGENDTITVGLVRTIFSF